MYVKVQILLMVLLAYVIKPLPLSAPKSGLTYPDNFFFYCVCLSNWSIYCSWYSSHSPPSVLCLSQFFSLGHPLSSFPLTEKSWFSLIASSKLLCLGPALGGPHIPVCSIHELMWPWIARFLMLCFKAYLNYKPTLGRAFVFFVQVSPVASNTEHKHLLSWLSNPSLRHICDTTWGPLKDSNLNKDREQWIYDKYIYLSRNYEIATVRLILQE